MKHYKVMKHSDCSGKVMNHGDLEIKNLSDPPAWRSKARPRRGIRDDAQMSLAPNRGSGSSSFSGENGNALAIKVIVCCMCIYINMCIYI